MIRYRFLKIIWQPLVLAMVMFLGIAGLGFSQKDAGAVDSPQSFEQIEIDSTAFVQEHHPDLVVLLQSLKAMRQKEYEVAIREIGRTRKRLESHLKKEPELYSMELDAWKLKSKIDLLMAKGIAQNKSFEKAVLRGLLREQIENQKRRLKHEQATLEKRQSQILESLTRLEGKEDEKTDQQLVNYLKSIDNKIGKTKKSKQDSKTNKEGSIKP